MEEKENVQGCLSQKEGYKYVWDEATNFIVYQNSNQDMIIGLCPHDGNIQESDIKKLYKISLKDFDITLLGSGFEVRFENKIYPQNFYSITDNEVSKVTINHAISKLCASYLDYDPKQLKITKELSFTTIVNISDTNLESIDKKAQFWEFENDDHVSISNMVTEIIRTILDCLYRIDITRMYYARFYEQFNTDFYNRELLRVINAYFIENCFKVIEDREKDATKIYDLAHEENKDYNDCISYLDLFVQLASYQDETPEDIKDACECAKIYKKITGENYNFADHIKSRI